MEAVLKLSALAITAALCSVVVRQKVPEIGMVLTLAAGLLIFGAAVSGIARVRLLIDLLAETAGLAPAVLAPVVKTAGIAIVTRVTGEVCRDAGESGIAAFAETAAAVLSLVIALPLLEAVLDTITGLL